MSMNPSRILIVSLSNCPAAGFAWSRSGDRVLTVVCRATLLLQPGRALLAPRQHLPVEGDRGFPDGSTGLYAPNDLTPKKPGAEVIVVGRASQAAVRLAIGSIDKRGSVVPGQPAPFGPVRPALGPRTWQGYSSPNDFDPAGLLVAPADQRLEVLRGDEPLILEGLHPDQAHLMTQLPGLLPIAIAEGPGSRAQRLPFQPDTLWIDAALGIAALVYRVDFSMKRGIVRQVLVDVELPDSIQRPKGSAGISTVAPSISVEECAAIAASVAREDARRPKILHANGLTEETWKLLDEYWSGRIQSEVERGKTSLLCAYDAAYVAQLAKDRGPITAQDYARIVVAAERNGVSEVMRAMELPPDALMRIRRVWMGKMAIDSEHGAHVRMAIDAERAR